MFTLHCAVFPHKVDIEIVDAAGVVRADVYLEIHDGKVNLVITDKMVERNSDDATLICHLLEDVKPTI